MKISNIAASSTNNAAATKDIDGNYRILKSIGEGTYSSVYKAVD